MASIRLAFLTKADPDSGNFNTAQRICEQLVIARPTWQYKIVPITEDSRHNWAQIASDLISADVLLCLHLYRCAEVVSRARSLVGSENQFPPVIGIAGGTDLNVDSHDPSRCEVMTKFVFGCKHLVVFSNHLLGALNAMIGTSNRQIPVSLIPQGISTPLLDGEAPQVPSVRQLGFQRYFIILGRIRPVKNCCSVLEPFSQWCQQQVQSQATADYQQTKVRLLFVGDIEDSEYGEDFKARIAVMPDVRLLCGVGHLQALQLMHRSLGLINCSLSEGQSNSVLEAMSLRVPTIVSAIPGNLGIVRHMETGFVYEDGKQLMQLMGILAAHDSENRGLVQRITEAAKTYVEEKHSVAKEVSAYMQLIADCCTTSV